MRGKAEVFVVDAVFARITPAYAGKSHPDRIRLHHWRDHPRLCGEKYSESEFFYKSLGSPPPMRGKVFLCTQDYIRHGDHPRLCGEKFFCVHRIISDTGITPAYAGKRRSSIR